MAAPRLPNYVGGAWVDAGPVETLADVDPASGETVAHVPLSGATAVDAAVAAARAAQPGWREVPPQQRARAILALREELLSRREELAALVSADPAEGGDAGGVDVESTRQPLRVATRQLFCTPSPIGLRSAK